MSVNHKETTMSLLLARVTRKDNGEFERLDPLDVEFANQEAIYKAMRDNSTAFVDGEEYYGIQMGKPIIKFTVKRKPVIEKGERL